MTSEIKDCLPTDDVEEQRMSSIGPNPDDTSFSDDSEDSSSASSCLSTDEEDDLVSLVSHDDHDETTTTTTTTPTTTTTTTTTTTAFHSFQTSMFALRQRRRNPTSLDLDYDPLDTDDEERGESPSKRNKDAGRHHSSNDNSNNKRALIRSDAHRTIRWRDQRHRRDLVWCRCSSYFLGIATFLWLSVHAYTSGDVIIQEWSFSKHDQEYAELVQERSMMMQGTKRRRPPGRPPPEDSPSWDQDLWNKKKRKKGKQHKENIPEGCYLQEWQTTSHPNCNELHQLDLENLLEHSFDMEVDSSTSGKYLSSGLWRDVWSLPVLGYKYDTHNQSSSSSVVLKMMKREHDVNLRNWERHKREAIVMDVLTKSPHIVNMYSYCGNTVLTEYLPMDLEDYLRPTKRRQQGQNKRKQAEPNTTPRTPRITTPEQRMDLAHQTAQALMDLHEYDVLHADLQSKQFMVAFPSSSSDETITIKLNDFNRCRFLPRRRQQQQPPPPPPPPNMGNSKSKSNHHNNATKDAAQGGPIICPIIIPSAPGLSRSPEEYELRGLTTSMDIYSLANIWFEILTGTTAWLEQPSTNKIKSLIIDGIKPALPEELTKNQKNQKNNNNNNNNENNEDGHHQHHHHSTDSSLAVLLSLAYEVDPQKRPTAKDLVQELKRLRGAIESNSSSSSSSSTQAAAAAAAAAAIE
jgi:serine/threonine protein kinase